MLRSLPTVLLIVLALLVAAGTPALAVAEKAPEEKKGEEKKGEGEKKEEDHKPGLLDPRLDLTIWTIVVFALLFVVLKYVKLPGAPAPAWVAMLEGLQKREHAIQSALDEAEKTREETKRLQTELQVRMDKA